MTASARRNRPPAATPAQPARSEKPAKPGGPARQVALVAARERVDPADRAPRRRLPPQQAPGPARLDGVAAVPRQRRDDVQLVPPGRELVDDAAQDATRRRGVRVDVRSDDDEAQRPIVARVRHHSTACAGAGRRRGTAGTPPRARRPTRRSRTSAARARPAAAMASRSISSSAPFHASSSSGRTSAASPATSGRAARSLHTTGVPSAIASSTGAPNPSYSDGKTSAVAPATRPSRSASGTRPGRMTRGTELQRRDRRGDVVLGQPAPAEEHEGEVRVGPRPGEQVEQEPVLLVGVGQRREHDVAAVADAVARPQLVVGRDGRRHVDAVGDDDDPLRLDAEAVDDRRADVLAGDGDDGGLAHRPGHGEPQVLALQRS